MHATLTIDNDNEKATWRIDEPEYTIMNGWRCIVKIMLMVYRRKDGKHKPLGDRPTSFTCVGGGKTPDTAYGQAIQDAHNRASGLT